MKTPEEFMISLNYDTFEKLEEAKKFLVDWDKRDKSYYKSKRKYIVDRDLAEREHLRNSIKFWEDKLNES